MASARRREIDRPQGARAGVAPKDGDAVVAAVGDVDKAVRRMDADLGDAAYAGKAGRKAWRRSACSSRAPASRPQAKTQTDESSSFAT